MMFWLLTHRKFNCPAVQLMSGPDLEILVPESGLPKLMKSNLTFPAEFEFRQNHIVWKLLKMSHLNFGISQFPPIFVLLKLTSLITLFDRSGNTVWLAKFASLPILNVNFSMILNHCDVPGIRRFPSRCGWLFWWRGTSRGIWPHERSRFAHLVCKHYVRWSRCESPVFVWKISAKNDKNVEGHLLKSSLPLDNFAPSP